MKLSSCLIIFVSAICPATGAEVGDTYQQVLAEKGKPSSEASAGAVRIMNYPDASFRIENNHVVAVKTPTEARGPVTRPVVRAASATPRTAPAPPSLEWTTEYTVALGRAKAENRQVFLFFTGSDWCGWCQRLDQEILSTAAFNRYAGEKLVLVKLDFPQQVEQSANLKKQNQRLSKQYKVQGYPTVVILGSDGKTVGRLGYQEGGPAPFLRALEGM